MSGERKRAWENVLFWSKRLTYLQAVNHPEWRENYLRAKERLKEIKERERMETDYQSRISCN